MPSRKKFRPRGWGDNQRTGVRTYPLFVRSEMAQELNVWELDVVTRKGEDCFPKYSKQFQLIITVPIKSFRREVTIKCFRCADFLCAYVRF